MIHPFFEEVKKYPDIADVCRLDITDIPQAYMGRGKLKAIMLGTDPTNNGLRGDGLIKLHHPFGIESQYEKSFFNPQQRNVDTIHRFIQDTLVSRKGHPDNNFSKDNLFIQNLCRNYFTLQASKNKKWYKTTRLWIKYLAKELKDLNPNTPILATSAMITFALVPDAEKIPIKEVYLMGKEPDFFCEALGRHVYPFYRHTDYQLDKWERYLRFLTERIQMYNVIKGDGQYK